MLVYLWRNDHLIKIVTGCLHDVQTFSHALFLLNEINNYFTYIYPTTGGRCPVVHSKGIIVPYTIITYWNSSGTSSKSPDSGWYIIRSPHNIRCIQICSMCYSCHRIVVPGSTGRILNRAMCENKIFVLFIASGSIISFFFFKFRLTRRQHPTIVFYWRVCVVQDRPRAWAYIKHCEHSVYSDYNDGVRAVASLHRIRKDIYRYMSMLSTVSP